MRLAITISGEKVEIDLPGVSRTVYRSTRNQLEKALQDSAKKNREAIATTFLYVLKRCPKANASDLWHHIVYRLYCEVLPKYRPQNPNQSWVRASGEALEAILEEMYAPFLLKRGVRIQALISRNKKREALKQMGLGKKVGDSKLDVVLYLEVKKDDWRIFGGIHVKASLAERISDDVPASRAMMKKGYFSPLWTFDVKSFPPPHGDLVNRGELGSPRFPSEKRKYIEEHGDFDGCYSANLRTVSSESKTMSGKRVFPLILSQQPDRFVKDIIKRAALWRKKLSRKR